MNLMLYFFVSLDEYQVNYGMEKFYDVLFSKIICELDWIYVEFVNEEYNFIVYLILYYGLRIYFKYY